MEEIVNGNKYAGVTRPYNLNRYPELGREKLYWKDLESAGLVRASYDEKGRNKVIKYTKRVFWDNLWHMDWRLPLCRGLVLDKDDRIISKPFNKVFNYLENGAGEDVSQTKHVIAVNKVNGFMATATWHGREFLVSTTGSLTSDFVGYAKEYLTDIGRSPLKEVLRANPEKSFIFEIVHPDDPHIVPELMGAHLIGCMDKWSGAKPVSEEYLDDFSIKMGVKRPFWKKIPFNDLLDENSWSEHEGFMVRNVTSHNTMFKLKTPYYLTKKFFMRSHKKLYNDPSAYKRSIPEEYYPLADHIREKFSHEDWKRMQEKHRRIVVEEFYLSYYGGINPMLRR